MSQVDVKKRVKKICPPRYFDKVWRTLVTLGRVEQLDVGELLWDDLVDDVRELVDIERDHDGGKEPSGWAAPQEEGELSPVAPRHKLGPLELERTLAFEEYLAYIAAADPGVYRFREEMLGGQVLTSEQARALVRSPALGFLPRGLFKRLDISFTDHSAELEWHGEVGAGQAATIRVCPPGFSKEIRPRVLRYMPFFAEDGHVERVSVSERSVLGALDRLGDRLTKSYMWEKAEAVWFVVTGAVPSFEPLKVQYCAHGVGKFTYGRITLEVAPWVNPETVHAAFRDARKRRRKKNRKNRPIGEKNLKLFRFVTKASDPVGKFRHGTSPNLTGISNPSGMSTAEHIGDLRYEKRPTGRELVEEWNQTEWVKENPDWAYPVNYSRILLRDYHRTRQALAYTVRL